MSSDSYTQISPEENGKDSGRRVVIVSAFRFPHGDAMSNRLLQLARSATLDGPLPIIINDWPLGVTFPESFEVPYGLNLITLSTRYRSRLGRLIARATRPLRVVRAMRAFGIRPGGHLAIVLPQGLLTVASVVAYKLWVSCQLVVDVTEHHDRNQFRGVLNSYYVRHRWTALLARISADRILTVSTRLSREFADSAPVKVVPPQVDSDEYAPCSPRPSDTACG